MVSQTRRMRFVYAACFAALLVVEVLIALFVHDRFIRPYGGDVLVTALICCFMRIFFVSGVPLLPLWVFLFAAAVEIGQYFDIVSRLGLDGCPVLSVALGNTFSPADLICYGAGCLLFFIAERLIRRRGKSLFADISKED